MRWDWEDGRQIGCCRVIRGKRQQQARAGIQLKGLNPPLQDPCFRGHSVEETNDRCENLRDSLDHKFF
jgi:hypothetical protein